MSEPFEEQALAGWGRLNPATCYAYRPERQRDLLAVVQERVRESYIARGLGRSYGDTSVNADQGVILMPRLNRMLDFNAETGVLTCESGVTLEEIIEAFLPRGWFLPVTPGTKFVTVGGAIANDVHGKNHHVDGTFGQFVQELTLLLASGETLVCSPSENADVFWATVGGIGLTGIIVQARIRLMPVETGYLSVDYSKCSNLDMALTKMADFDRDHKYSVAWIDCLARGKHLGRAVLMHGNHATPDQLSLFQRKHPLEVPAKGRKNIPVDLPGMVLNPLSIKAFNTLFYAKHYDHPAMVVDYDSYFYPLDAVHNWNRMYGKRGFVQYQATLPQESAAGLVKLLERLSQSRRASFLAVLKCFGDANDGMLSHPIRGYTLALDLPWRRNLAALLHELDKIVLDCGGRLYLAKDATTSPETFRQMYPRLPEFQAVKNRLDPEQVFSSSMARRLALVDSPRPSAEPVKEHAHA